MRTKSELSKAKRRIRQLEKCLENVAQLLFERAVELNAAGRDERDNPEYRFLRSIMARINRTMH